MIKPPFLQKGDKVAIVASARKISADEIRPAIMLLKEWGFEVIKGENLHKEHHQFAGTDAERAADMQWALDDENIKAVFCARGGYGTVRVIDRLNFDAFVKHPKWVIGYSDITVLHQHINQNFGIASLHGTMPINFEKNVEATETLRKALFGDAIEYSLEPHSLNVNGEASGELIGGNLSLIYALCGSVSDIDTKGKILFIEDLDEYLYHIDRMMMNLKRSGKLKNLAGLIVGGMTDMKDNAVPFGKNAEEIVCESVKQYGYPVCFGFPAGHIDRNLAIKFGAASKLIVTNSKVLFDQE